MPHEDSSNIPLHPLGGEERFLCGENSLELHETPRGRSEAESGAWAQSFFVWYNQEHHHTGLGLLTPAVVHHEQTETVLQKRQQVLDVAYAAHLERFVKHPPMPARLPAVVWINPPKPAGDTAVPLQ